MEQLKQFLFGKFVEEIISYLVNKHEDEENMEEIQQNVAERFVEQNQQKIKNFVDQMINDADEEDDLQHPENDWFREYIFADNEFVVMMNSLTNQD
jgi:hypothetical protein